MIHIVQCLCENRHAIYAIAYDDTRDDGKNISESLQALVEMWVDHRIIQPACGICGSSKWHYEDGLTRWNTMEEAYPNLKVTEQANLESRKIIDQLKAEKN